jgi:diguanylate cyclase (GGDEF)-like protein/PAS domain S-box-containing protein
MLDEVFGDTQAERLDAQTIELALSALLALHPTAPVAALNEAGLYVEMPDSIALGENPVMTGRSGLDGASDGDRARLLSNWERVMRIGAARCVIAPANFGPIALHILDLRESHGVLFSMLVGAEPQEAESSEEGTIEHERPVPRFATITKDVQAHIGSIDDAITAILGWSPEEMIGHRSLDFVHADDHQLAVDNWVQMMAQPGPARRVRQRLRHRDGSWVWFEIINHNLLEDPDHGCVVSEMVDISEEMAAHEEVRARGQLLDRLAETVPVGLIQIDAEANVVYTNDRLHEILGTARAETLGDQLAALGASDRVLVGEAVARVLKEGSGADVEVELWLGAQETPRYCTVSLRALTHEDGTVSGAIGCVADVTDGTRMREELRKRATTDELTGCLNRAAILHALEDHIACGKRRAERAIMFIDLDEFKAINDHYGHSAGDELLRTVAKQLRSAVREEDLVGRIGGDEFLIVCPDVGGAHRAVRLAERIEKTLRDSVSASIGVAWSCGEDGADGELLERADRAMYAAKRRRVGRQGRSSANDIAA